jgi:hypothetical protein
MHGVRRQRRACGVAHRLDAAVLIGLGRLMSFVARESGVEVGALTVVSTHAEIDKPGASRRSDIEAMIGRFDQANAAPFAA